MSALVLRDLAELMIYTPEELDRMIADENPLILQALAEGVVLHQAEQG